jgi:membrane-associated phospholipid phosphatase
VGAAGQAIAAGATELARPTGPARRRTIATRTALERARWSQLATFGALAAFGGVFAAVKAGRSAAIDIAITLRLQRIRRPAFARLMRAISWPGFPPQSRIIPPVVLSSLWLLGLRLEAVFQGIAWGGALLSTAIKSVARRPRPAGSGIDVVVAPLGGSSFPSGHVLTYVGFYGFLAHLAHALIRPASIRRPIVVLLTGLVAFVGPSRIAQGHHWPTDVLASYLVGLPFLATVIGAYRRVKRRATQPPVSG